MKIKVTFWNGDDEVTAELPAKNEVCDKCEGHGTHLNPSIGEHAYSAEEFHESFDDEQAEEYFKRGGMYDVTCSVCKGKNVVLVVDSSQCTTPEQKETLKAHKRYMKAQRDADREWQTEMRNEAMMLGEY